VTVQVIWSGFTLAFSPSATSHLSVYWTVLHGRIERLLRVLDVQCQTDKALSPCTLRAADRLSLCGIACTIHFIHFLPYGCFISEVFLTSVLLGQ
jgi:hypothetical protein